MRSRNSSAYDRFFTPLLREAWELGFTAIRGHEGRNYRHFATGLPGFLYSVSFSRDGFRVEIALEHGDRDKNRFAFDSLKKNQKEIEQQLGNLVWDRDGRAGRRKASRIYSRREGTINSSSSVLSELKEWALARLCQLEAAFVSYSDTGK